MRPLRLWRHCLVGVTPHGTYLTQLWYFWLHCGTYCTFAIYCNDTLLWCRWACEDIVWLDGLHSLMVLVFPQGAYLGNLWYFCQDTISFFALWLIVDFCGFLDTFCTICCGLPSCQQAFEEFVCEWQDRKKFCSRVCFEIPRHFFTEYFPLLT